MSESTPQPFSYQEVPYNNQSLFSNYPLDNRLGNDPLREKAEANDFADWLRGHYAQEKDQLPHYNESQLEDHWFVPILTRLGHIFERQATIPGLDSYIKKPDFVFFADDTARQSAVSTQRSADYTTHALAIAEVKAWDIPLGRKLPGGTPSFADQNPSFQINSYLQTTSLNWGILSNGRLWRIVHRESSHKLTTYYEVDLIDLLTTGKELRYFTLFFQQAAFLTDAQGRQFLDDTLQASRRYAIELEIDLQNNAYEALQWLMQGFFDATTNHLTLDDLPAIYENSLYLLYRLLFILYAESRGLLPLNKPIYRDQYSLERVKNDIAKIDLHAVAPMGKHYWCFLESLFEIINGDNEPLNRFLALPRYNGGLFSPSEHPFLHQYKVGDRALAEAIDLLSRRQTEKGKEFVDYRTLGVRQLGSIYEGLLEYQPVIAKTEMVAVREGKSTRWVSADEASPKAAIVERIPAGRTYLATDKGERKATGSYYTPEYIVAYIVKNTLDPLVKEAKERVRLRGQSADKSDKSAVAQSFIDEIFKLKVLDPAMGSGHFLVEATDFLAQTLAADPYISRPKGEKGDGDDVVYWKRRVVERCIYGVDKNPLAVELAKLSLWLVTVAIDQPLSFLDHHLKCGDSLIGARVDALGWMPPALLDKKGLKSLEKMQSGQVNLFQYRLSQQLPAVMGKVLEIVGRDSDSYETVQAKEAADEAVRQLKAPFVSVANLWTSGYFGHEYTSAEFDEALNALNSASLWEMPVIQQAEKITAERSFFHWELIFPEVFYDEQGHSLGEDAGFHAVIGNPPYGFISNKFDQTILKTQLKTESALDLYIAFIDQGFQLATINGLLSYIAPTSLQTGIPYRNLRGFLLATGEINKIVNLPYNVFSDAYIDTAIYIVQKKRNKPIEKPVEFLISAYNFDKREDPETKLLADLNYVKISSAQWMQDDQLRFLTSAGLPKIQLLLRKIPTVYLGDITESTRGILVDQEYINSNQLNASWKPYFDGDIYRYQKSMPAMKWVQYRKNLRESPTSYHYFVGPRLLVRRLISRKFRLMATYADSEFINKKDVYNILAKGDYSLFALLGLLNSQLYSYLYVAQSTVASRDDFPQVTLAGLRQLPIRKIEFTTSAEERHLLGEQAKTFYQQGEDQTVLDFVAERLAQVPEQSDVVHDLLAYLAEQMIAMNKDKLECVSDFWLDLEGITDTKTFEILRHKGKQYASLHKGVAAARPFISAESHSNVTLDATLDWNEEAFKGFIKLLVPQLKNMSKVVRVYRDHTPLVRPLSERIGRTDQLIDFIVYKLYGLTDDEIAIITK